MGNMRQTALRPALDNRQWLPKVLAAVFPGCGLAFAIMGLLGLLSGTTGDARTLSAQALMWLTATLWLLVLGTCFLFASARQAWAVLGGGCVLLWGFFLLLRTILS